MKKVFLIVCLLFVVAPISLAENNPCNNPQTKAEMRECNEWEFNKADAELTKVYKKLLKKDARHKKQLVKTELNWIKWKDYECEYQSLAYERGTLAPREWQKCLTNLTKERTEHLKYMLVKLEG